MASKKTPLSKSDFIRSQPATLSAAELVAKAKAAGVTIRPGLVYEVRRTAKAQKGTAKKTSTAPTSAAAKSPAPTSKADFVRSHANLSPKEIVAKAKGEGVKLEMRYVYRVRGSDKTAGKKAVARRSTVRKADAVPRPLTTASSAEDLLRAVAAEVGLGRAIELLQGERARVHSILRG